MCFADDDSTEKKVEADVKKEPGSVKAEGGGDTGDKPAGTDEEEEEGGDERKDALELREREEGKLGLERVSAALRDEMRLLMGENRRLQDLTTEVHQRSHEITLKVRRKGRGRQGHGRHGHLGGTRHYAIIALDLLTRFEYSPILYTKSIIRPCSHVIGTGPGARVSRGTLPTGLRSVRVRVPTHSVVPVVPVSRDHLST